MNRGNLVSSIKYTLWSIGHTGIKNAEAALCQLVTHNTLDYFVPIFEECIMVSRNNKDICLYLELIDQLLNYPYFNSLLHSCLGRIYPEIVKALDNQGLYQKVEKAKVIRKQWVRGRVHPGLYAHLREETLRRANIDVEILK